MSPEHQFTDILSAIWLSSGGWFVLDARSSRVRIYHPDGPPERDLGRSGEGPGEFRMAVWAGESGPGRIVVLDAALRRISIFGPGGNLEGEWPLPLPPEVPPSPRRRGTAGDVTPYPDRRPGDAPSTTSMEGS